MFSLRNFVKNGFLKAVGKMSDYQIILNAAGWNEKGVLTEDDLEQIQEAIDAQYPEEPEMEETQSDVESEAPNENNN